MSAAVAISTPFAGGEPSPAVESQGMSADVLIQATRTGVRIMLPDGVGADALAELGRRLGTPPALAGATVTLVPAGALRVNDLGALENLLIGRHSAVCVEVVRAAAVDAGAGRGTGALATPEARARQGDGRAAPATGDSLLVRRTLRSGQRIRFAGNVVVLGDVNPGAEIVAGGDIVVMGTLRGVAHAGAAGDADAIVAAFRLQPTQIRVGGVIGRSPDGAYERPEIPEIARVREGVLVVERLQPGFGEIAAGDRQA